jgi:hypothetical protein
LYYPNKINQKGKYSSSSNSFLKTFDLIGLRPFFFFPPFFFPFPLALLNGLDPGRAIFGFAVFPFLAWLDLALAGLVGLGWAWLGLALCDSLVLESFSSTVPSR